MSVNNKNSYEPEYCYHCQYEVNVRDARNKKNCESCNRAFHKKCWQNTCTSYECQKPLKEKQYSIENWRTVKTTAVIVAVVFGLHWLIGNKK